MEIIKFIKGQTQWHLDGKRIMGYTGRNPVLITPREATILVSLGKTYETNSKTAKTLIITKNIIRVIDPGCRKRNLKKAIIENGVTYLEDHCLSDNPDLEELVLPSPIDFISSDTFSKTNIRKLTVNPQTDLFDYFKSTFGDKVTELNIVMPIPQEEIVIHMLKSLIAQGIDYIEKIRILANPIDDDMCKYLETKFPHTQIINSPIAGYNDLDVTDEMWTIRNGILLDYHGTSKEITIPEGVTQIVECALANKGLTKVNLPSSLIRIEEKSFENNRLTGIKIPSSVTYIGFDAFAGNPLRNIEIIHYCPQILWQSFPANSYTKLAIHISNISYYRRNNRFANRQKGVEYSAEEMQEDLLKCRAIKDLTIYCENAPMPEIVQKLESWPLPKLKKLTLVGKEYSKEELDLLCRAVTRKKRESNKYATKVRIVNITATEEEFAIEGALTKEKSQSDIEILVNDIQNNATHLAVEDRKKVSEKVDNLLEEYEKLLASMKDSRDIQTEDLVLVNTPYNPAIAKSILLMRLDKILNELKSNNSVEFLRSLENYKKILYREIHERPTDLSTLEGKVGYICYMAKTYNFPSLIDFLESKIEAAKIATSSEVTRFLNTEIALETKVSEAFEQDIENKFTELETCEQILKELQGTGESQLSNIINYLRATIDTLYEKDKQNFTDRLNSIIKKQKDRLFEQEIDREELLEDLRSLKETIDEVYPTSRLRKDLYQTLHECALAIKPMTDEDELKLSSPASIIFDIRKMLESEELVNDREETTETIKKTLSKWFGIIRANTLNDEIAKSIMAIKKGTEDYKKIKWLNLNPEIVAKIILMKELQAIYIHTRNILDKNQKVAQYEKELQFRRKTDIQA